METPPPQASHHVGNSFSEEAGRRGVSSSLLSGTECNHSQRPSYHARMTHKELDQCFCSLTTERPFKKCRKPVVFKIPHYKAT